MADKLRVPTEQDFHRSENSPRDQLIACARKLRELVTLARLTMNVLDTDREHGCTVDGKPLEAECPACGLVESLNGVILGGDEGREG